MYENLLAHVPTDLWIGGKWRKASDNARFDVIDPATERLLGVGIVGPGAGEMIAEGVLAIEMGANATDLKLSIQGMKGSLSANDSEQRPRARWNVCPSRIKSSRKVSTRAVFPSPKSPLTQTIPP